MKTETQFNTDECVQKLGSMIKEIKFAMVTSANDRHELHSCPLTVQEVEFDGDLWFVIGKNSEVATNVSNHAPVNVSFASDKGTYISAVGEAEVLFDRAKLEEFWNPAFKVWFKEGIDDPNIALLRVHVISAEYWESPSFTVTKLAAFAKAFITGNSESIGEHRKLNLN